MFVIAGALLAWQMGILGVLIAISAGIPLFLLGRSSKKLDIKARSLPCSEPELEDQYRKVGASWTSKLLPDF